MSRRPSDALAPAGGIGEYLDQRPIKLAGFTLRARSATPMGRPTLDQWTSALAFAHAVNGASPYWIGDLLRYAEDRQDWQVKLDQALSVTGVALKTAINMTYIARHVDEATRELAPSISHAAEVASLDRSEQTSFLERASTEGWTRRELREHVKAAKRPRVLEGQAILAGMFRVIYADPDPTLPVKDLSALPVAAHALPNAVLFLWTTAARILANPGPRDVMESWAFTPKTCRIWDKVVGRPGHYGLSVRHEILLIGVRGVCLPDVPTPEDDSIEVVRQAQEHGPKPEAFRRFIMRHWTQGPYLELFARQAMPGWTSFGADAKRWASEVAS
jgi:N6-adenosine-specific RNA methylase IME4